MMKHLYSFVLFVGLTVSAMAQTDMRGTIRQLPLLNTASTEIHYQGSIDKTGGNADWNWFLYQDDNQEWVVLDVDGPGRIENLTQHRYFTASDPLFRFYIDGAKKPQYEVRLSEIGIKFPFKKPLADCYIGPYDNGRGPIRVAHSFVPITFNKHCKVTTDACLYGNDLQKGESGWGHITYHTFDRPQGDSKNTFSENLEENRRLKLAGLTMTDDAQQVSVSGKVLKAGQEYQLAHLQQAGVLTAVRLYAGRIDSTALQNVWISITFDGHRQPDVLCPIGAFFGNSLGCNSVEYLMMGVSKNGTLYNTFPMPFWQDAVVCIVNKGREDFPLAGGYLAVAANTYRQELTGYFRNTPFYSRKYTPGADSRIAHITGHGKMVAAHITCWADKANTISCEGDVHVYIDGERTPRMQSDGSESYISFGWGFPTPPETHPFGGYDGLADNPWSMTRLCLLDYYPFNQDLTFNIESGEHNNQYLEHSGTIFYYGTDTPGAIVTDNICLTDKKSKKKHQCRLTGSYKVLTETSVYEGTYNKDSLQQSFISYEEGATLSFKAAILPDNDGIRLMRTSCQYYPRQMAEIYVDGQRVTERNWYHPDYNPFMQWLDDSFVIPAHYTHGKSSILIEIRPQPCDGKVAWTDLNYQVSSIVKNN